MQARRWYVVPEARDRGNCRNRTTEGLSQAVNIVNVPFFYVINICVALCPSVPRYCCNVDFLALHLVDNITHFANVAEFIDKLLSIIERPPTHKVKDPATRCTTLVMAGEV